MRTVKWLREELAKFPDDALCFAYEGEVTGIVIEIAGKRMRDQIANATGDDDAAPECTCAAKDMTFGRCCKVTPNASVNPPTREEPNDGQ